MKLKISNYIMATFSIKIKCLKILIVFCFSSITLAGQIKSNFNVGFDYSIIIKSENNYSGSNYYSSRGGVSLGADFRIKSLEKFVFSPGLSYKTINESSSSGGMGGGQFNYLNHHSVNGNMKIIRIFKINEPEPVFLFCGVFGGFQIKTWANGSTQSYSIMYPQANWSDDDVNIHPSHLFRKTFFGIISGIGLESSLFFNPQMELRYLPIYGKYRESNLNLLEIALVMKIN